MNIECPSSNFLGGVDDTFCDFSSPWRPCNWFQGIVIIRSGHTAIRNFTFVVFALWFIHRNGSAQQSFRNWRQPISIEKSHQWKIIIRALDWTNDIFSPVRNRPSCNFGRLANLANRFNKVLEWIQVLNIKKGKSMNYWNPNIPSPFLSISLAGLEPSPYFKTNLL
jgi:hypothetical protein